MLFLRIHLYAFINIFGMFQKMLQEFIQERLNKMATRRALVTIKKKGRLNKD